MKYIITEAQKRRIISDKKLSSISKTVTQAFKPIYPLIEEIILVPLEIPGVELNPMLYMAYIYVIEQPSWSDERKIAEEVGSFIEDNFNITARRIIFDSVHFYYQDKPKYYYHDGKIVS